MTKLSLTLGLKGTVPQAIPVTSAAKKSPEAKPAEPVKNSGPTKVAVKVPA